MLMLAEMNWNNLLGKKFARYGFYCKALACTKPGSKDKWFSPDTDQYCAIFVGIARDALSSQNPQEKKKFFKLERAVNAILSVNDCLYFQCSNLSQALINKLWVGDYERLEDAGNEIKQRARTQEEKNRDFLLLSRIYRHAAELGLHNPNLPLGGLEQDIHDPGMGLFNLHQFDVVLRHEAQTLLFVRKGHTRWMIDCK